MKINNWGWNQTFEKEYKKTEKPGYFPARIICEQREQYQIYSEKGIFPAEISGKLRHIASSRKDFPAVGDFVSVKLSPQKDRVIIYNVLKRKNLLSRKLPSGSKSASLKFEEQIIATNLDIVFIVSSLNEEFNIRRLERYFTFAKDIFKVLILNKMDLCKNIHDYVDELSKVAPEIEFFSVSAKENVGLDEIKKKYLKKGITGALVGSSGVGKSTIINQLLGNNRQEVRPVREFDSKGSHTTSKRELIMIPGGSMIIDNPGMRELHLWDGGENFDEAFNDIETMARNCFFGNCSHNSEPDCAVKRALSEGKLDLNRLNNYIALKNENNMKNHFPRKKAKKNKRG